MYVCIYIYIYMYIRVGMRVRRLGSARARAGGRYAARLGIVYVYMYITFSLSLSLYIYIYMYICVNNIPHGHALFRRIMLLSGETWYAVRTVEHVTYNTCDHFGLKCEQLATCALEQNALVPDRLQKEKTGRPAMDVF